MSYFGWKLKQVQYHIPISKLEELRLKSDDPCDNALKVLNEFNISVDNYLNDVIDHNDNPNKAIKYNYKELNPLTQQIIKYPDWLNFETLKKGQLVFYRYASSASMALLYFSLVGGFSAPKIVKVI